MPERPRTRELQGTIKIIGIVELVLGIFDLFVCLILALFYTFIPELIRETETTDISPEVIAQLIEAIFLIIIVVFLVVGLLSIISAILLLRYKNSGRTGTMIVGAISLINFPIGTLFGVAALYYLTRPEAEYLFS
jgi:ABC-type phosphate transport system permease subunit